MLDDFNPSHDFLIGIDSDGCAFDTMEVKHKECFIPNIVCYYRLAAVSKFAREAAEFVNLYSKWRGINRFPALLMALDLLAERPEVRARGIVVPKLPAVREWVANETKLANPALKEAVEKHKIEELAHLLEWSKSVNESVEKVVHAVPPFPMVRESLRQLDGKADVLVVSATPGEALKREWTEHDIAKHVARICGQEIGTKKEILQVAGKYPKGNVLMLGDAPGDLEAARKNDALFFPINPGKEDESWHRFHDEAIQKFLTGSYAGEYEQKLIRDFEAILPATPPWQKS